MRRHNFVETLYTIKYNKKIIHEESTMQTCTYEQHASNKHDRGM